MTDTHAKLWQGYKSAVIQSEHFGIPIKSAKYVLEKMTNSHMTLDELKPD